MTIEPLQLREAVNVPDFQQRDKLVRRLAEIRAGVVLDLNTLRYWNEQHPDEPPVDTTFEERVIDWCDGKGPFPKLPQEEQHG